MSASLRRLHWIYAHHLPSHSDNDFITADGNQMEATPYSSSESLVQ
jgi:hypothetical protein